MKKDSKYVGIIIGLFAVILVLTGYIIYDKISYKDITNNDDQVNITCNDCVSKIDFNKEGSEFTKKILLGNKIMELKYYTDFNDNRTIEIDNQVFDFYSPVYEGFSEIYILNNDVLMVVTTGSDIRTDNFEFYDSNLRKINVETTLDKEFPNSMRIASYEVKDNKIKVTGTRYAHEKELQDENSEFIKMCEYDENHNYGLNQENYSKHKGEVVSAKYEMEYLGNGKFSEFKRVEVLEKLDENYCNW